MKGEIEDSSSLITASTLNESFPQKKYTGRNLSLANDLEASRIEGIFTLLLAIKELNVSNYNFIYNYINNRAVVLSFCFPDCINNFDTIYNFTEYSMFIIKPGCGG